MMTQTKVMRVLVVDDERIVCSGVEKILVRQGPHRRTGALACRKP
ncbi:MAG: response regulator [Desulfobacterales bacterium]|nr:response regulator [Desulfobacterales bacterium]